MLMNQAFLADLTTNLKVVSSRSYEARAKNAWWTRVAAQRSAASKREVLTWLLDQWKLGIDSTDGNMDFEDAILRLHEYTHSFEQAGIELHESDFEDLDGAGINVATEWVKKMGSEFAYSPQRQLAEGILANRRTYDGKPFFATDHPVSGKSGDTSLGTYANLFGSLPIDDSVTLEVAKKNLGRAIAKARAIKAPDGSPRGLAPAGILVPTALSTRATDLTAARYLGAGGGSTDHGPVLSAWNLGVPAVADELGADFSGSDTDYYLIMADPTVDDVGAFVWSVRKPYAIRYPSLQDSIYQEQNKLKWTARGRTALVPGHPFLLIKVRASAV